MVSATRISVQHILEKATKCEKEKIEMLNNNNQVRVLSRMGAREITPEESAQIGGGFIPTLLSVIMTGVPLGTDHRLDE